MAAYEKIQLLNIWHSVLVVFFYNLESAKSGRVGPARHGLVQPGDEGDLPTARSRSISAIPTLRGLSPVPGGPVAEIRGREVEHQLRGAAQQSGTVVNGSNRAPSTNRAPPPNRAPPTNRAPSPSAGSIAKNWSPFFAKMLQSMKSEFMGLRKLNQLIFNFVISITSIFFKNCTELTFLTYCKCTYRRWAGTGSDIFSGTSTPRRTCVSGRPLPSFERRRTRAAPWPIWPSRSLDSIWPRAPQTRYLYFD